MTITQAEIDAALKAADDAGAPFPEHLMHRVLRAAAAARKEPEPSPSALALVEKVRDGACWPDENRGPLFRFEHSPERAAALIEAHVAQEVAAMKAERAKSEACLEQVRRECLATGKNFSGLLSRAEKAEREAAALREGASTVSALWIQAKGDIGVIKGRLARAKEALSELIAVAEKAIYPKPDVGPGHPFAVLTRAKKTLAEMEKTL